jgi:hypothetical protein
MIPEGDLKNTVFFTGKYCHHPIYSLSDIPHITRTQMIIISSKKGERRMGK